MSEITRFDHYNKDGYDIYIERGTGRVAASVSSYARMAQISKQAVSQRLTKGVNQNEQETVEVITPGGLQGVNLIWEHTIAKWIVRDNPEQAEKMITAGVRVFLHGLVGHSVKPELPDAVESEPVGPKMLPDKDIIVQVWKSELERAIKNSDQRRIHFYTNAINQWSQAVFLNPLGAIEGDDQTLPTKSEPTVEGVIDVVIRLGLKCPRNLESSLGKYVKKCCGDLLCGQDNRFSQTSDKVVPANMYPYKHPRVELAVREYLELKGV